MKKNANLSPAISVDDYKRLSVFRFEEKTNV